MSERADISQEDSETLRAMLGALQATRRSEKSQYETELASAKADLAAADANARNLETERGALQGALQRALDDLASAKTELEDQTAELEAYKKAKAENDERFMLEREEARAALVKANEDYDGLDVSLRRLTRERDEAGRWLRANQKENVRLKRDLASALAVVEAMRQLYDEDVLACLTPTVGANGDGDVCLVCSACMALAALATYDRAQTAEGATGGESVEVSTKADGWIVGHLPGDPPGPASLRWVRADGRVFDCVPRSTEKRDTGRTLTESELAEVRDKYENAKGGDVDAAGCARATPPRERDVTSGGVDSTSAEPAQDVGQPWIAEPDDGEERVAAHMINLLAAVKRARDEANLRLNRDAVHSLALAIERLAVLVTGPRIRSIARQEAASVVSKAANSAATKLGAAGREQECETMEALVDALASQV